MSEKIYREMMEAAHEADVCQKVIDEMRFRGVTDTVAIAVVRTCRNSADIRYKKLREQYGLIAREAFAAMRER